MSQPVSRRDLFRTVGAGAASLAVPAVFVGAASAQQPTAETSPNARPRLALIGCGGMGQYDATVAQQFADIVAVCDVDADHAGQASEKFGKAKVYYDFRQVCDLPDVDVVLNATPDHWHTLVNLRAIASGKDVYSEKPLTLTLDEGKRLVAAVRSSDRILQTGTQQRSDATFQHAAQMVRDGKLGKISRVTTWIPMGLHDGPFAPAPAPQQLNWDFWQGQTPAMSYVPQRCHGKFRYWWEYGAGTVTDWGAHHNDVALWGLGKEQTGPVRIEGEALVDTVPGGFTTPSQFRIRYEYADGIEHICTTTSANGWAGAVLGEPQAGERYHGVQFEGERGWLYVSRESILDASDPDLIRDAPARERFRNASVDHMANFFACAQSRERPVADVEIGHRSVSVCHLGAISMRLGRPLQWDPVAEDFVGDPEASGMRAREQRAPYTYDMALA